MNGKRAKILRRIAEGVTKGKPLVCYEVIRHNPGARQIVLGDCTRKLHKRIKQS